MTVNKTFYKYYSQNGRSTIKELPKIISNFSNFFKSNIYKKSVLLNHFFMCSHVEVTIVCLQFPINVSTSQLVFVQLFTLFLFPKQ